MAQEYNVPAGTRGNLQVSWPANRTPGRLPQFRIEPFPTTPPDCIALITPYSAEGIALGLDRDSCRLIAEAPGTCTIIASVKCGPADRPSTHAELPPITFTVLPYAGPEEAIIHYTQI